MAKEMDMLKRLSIAGIIFAASTNLVFADTLAHAHPQPRRMHYKGEVFAPPPAPPAPTYSHFSFGGGAYVGVDLGLRTNYSSNPSVYKGLEGTILGGFGYLSRSGFYIAEEVFAADGFQLQGYSNNNNGKPGVKSSWSLGLSILPGYLILDNVLAYGRLGVVKTYFSNSGGNANGGQVGLGLQTALTESWDLRGEYIYSFYSSVSGNCTSPPDSAVKADQFNMGLIYKFM
jgi:opacity protein-like surface antigen